MLRLLLLPALCLAMLGQQSGRVYLISLDGLGFEAFSQDPAASELKTMRMLAEEGIYAPMQAAFPSLTAPGHASIFTGVYGDRNGITANQVPVAFDRRVNGFRADQLLADTFWVKAGRTGIRSVAHNATQGFPCNAHNSGPNVTLVNGYQTEELSPQRLLRGKDVEWLSSAPEGFAAPSSAGLPVRFFRYTSGRLQFAGAVFAQGGRYSAIRLSARSGSRYVDARMQSAENEPIRAGGQSRPLARHFSEALTVAGMTAVHFRLFELSPDGKNFLLYQTEAKGISVCQNGTSQAEAFQRRLLQTAGGFIGNGAGRFFEQGQFGKPGTDGVAERRWLETLELHARQTMRHTRALVSEFGPRLVVDYLSTADDMLHVWWGAYVAGDRNQEPWRRWGYQIIDWRIEQLRQMLGSEDHLIIVSDHGMTSARREFRINSLLRQWGFGDRVWAQDSFLRLKDRDDKELLREVQEKLASYTDGETRLFAAWFEPVAARERFGIGGEFGGDLYFDLAPGYYVSSALKEPVIESYPAPRGVHGPLPTRTDLLALFLAHGPRLDSRPVSMRTIDVAPLVLKLLGL